MRFRFAKTLPALVPEIAVSREPLGKNSINKSAGSLRTCETTWGGGDSSFYCASSRSPGSPSRVLPCGTRLMSFKFRSNKLLDVESLLYRRTHTSLRREALASQHAGYWPRKISVK